MKPYRYVKLSNLEYASLESGFKYGTKSHFRIRCHAILLSHEGHRIEYIANLYKKRKETIRDWMNGWESKGIAGLMIESGRGRKPALDISVTTRVDLIKKSQRTTGKTKWHS